MPPYFWDGTRPLFKNKSYFKEIQMQWTRAPMTWPLEGTAQK